MSLRLICCKIRTRFQPIVGLTSILFAIAYKNKIDLKINNFLRLPPSQDFIAGGNFQRTQKNTIFAEKYLIEIENLIELFMSKNNLTFKKRFYFNALLFRILIYEISKATTKDDFFKYKTLIT